MSKEENLERNKQLSELLQKYGYGFTKVNGTWSRI
jgi:hypothetical protein